MLTLLMTETSPEVCRLCKETLAASHIDVSICPRNGAAAYSALAQMQPDAALLDVFMPGMNAFEVKKQFDEAYPDGKTVFFVTSPFPNDEIEREAMESGFAFYYIKPFDVTALGRRICQSAKVPYRDYTGYGNYTRAETADTVDLYINRYYQLAGIQKPSGDVLKCLKQMVKSHRELGTGLDDIALTTANALAMDERIVEAILQIHCDDMALATGVEPLQWKDWVACLFDALDHTVESLA